MKVREMCYIAVIGAIETIVFTSFSFVLYLECITLTVLLFAMSFHSKQAVMGAIVFGIVNLCLQGVTPWSLMYLLIYPLYSLGIGSMKHFLQHHFMLLVILCGILSFLSGQLVQLPFMLVSKNLTLLYVIAGLKTSFMQGCISACTCLICYKPLYAIIKKIERRLNYEEAM